VSPTHASSKWSAHDPVSRTTRVSDKAVIHPASHSVRRQSGPPKDYALRAWPSSLLSLCRPVVCFLVGSPSSRPGPVVPVRSFRSGRSGLVVHGLAVHGLAVHGLAVRGLVVCGLAVRGLVRLLSRRLCPAAECVARRGADECWVTSAKCAGDQIVRGPLRSHASGRHLNAGGLSPLSFAYFSLRRQRKVGAAPHRGSANSPT
jgi:hypothetical protein